MLNINATPAEVARGCRFAERFVDPIAVAKNRGTVTGTVPIKYPRGVLFNGVAGNYLTYPIGGVLNKPAISIVTTFYPNYLGNDSVGHYIFDSTNGSRYTVAKNASNDLVFLLGNTLFAAIGYAVFGPYWNANQRNTIMITGISGNNAFYLNGNLIGSNVTAWTVADPATFYIGVRYDNTLPHDGYISMLKIFTGNVVADLLTLADAQAYWKNEI